MSFDKVFDLAAGVYFYFYNNCILLLLLLLLLLLVLLLLPLLVLLLLLLMMMWYLCRISDTTVITRSCVLLQVIRIGLKDRPHNADCFASCCFIQ